MAILLVQLPGHFGHFIVALAKAHLVIFLFKETL